MRLNDVMKQLESMGTAQNRKVYRRHGVVSPVFGVSFANLKKLKKAIGVDHELAAELWATRNHDARVLATMIADPAQMAKSEMDAWSRELDNYVVADSFSSLVGRGPHARSRFEKWRDSKHEFVGAAAWNILAIVAMHDRTLDDGFLEEQIARIEVEIHARPNRQRYSMNNALIAIGGRSPKLGTKAIAAASRIGPVHVDHGETGCMTPDATVYIRKMSERKKAKRNGKK